jgi:hypothetical protein
VSVFQGAPIPSGSPPAFTAPAPALTAAAAITGTLTLGQTLTLPDGSWSGSPTGFLKQWLRNGAPIPGATAGTYTLVADDVGQEIAGEVVALNGSGPSLPARVVAGRCRQVPVNTGRPTASAIPLVGQVVTVKPGIWVGFPEAAFSYQWRRGASNIAGATGASYTLVDLDIAELITCRVTGTNSAGSNTADTNAIGPVAAALVAPVNTAAPAITGTPTVGQTLTASTGTWTGSPAPSFAYQWRRNGTDIAGATASTYLLQAADEGATITVRVTATNSQGSAGATSAGVGPVAAEAGGFSISYAGGSAAHAWNLPSFGAVTINNPPPDLVLEVVTPGFAVVGY